MSHKLDVPKVVLDSFPMLSKLAFIRRYTLPDTSFDIFTTDTGELFSLVTTDYADPYDQSCELRNASGEHRFVFEHLIKSHSSDYEIVAILQHDEMEGDFFVTTPYKKYKLYYYLARIKSDLG